MAYDDLDDDGRAVVDAALKQKGITPKGKGRELDRFNDALRAHPEYRAFLRSIGVNLRQPGGRLVSVTGHRPIGLHTGKSIRVSAERQPPSTGSRVQAHGASLRLGMQPLGFT